MYAIFLKFKTLAQNFEKIQKIAKTHNFFKKNYRFCVCRSGFKRNEISIVAEKSQFLIENFKV